MDRNIRIAVLIPTYNRADIITHCLASLMEHLTCRNATFEFRVGIDGDDGTPERLREWWNNNSAHYHAHSKYLSWIVNSPRLGLGGNLNALLKINDAPLIMQMDDDHILKEPLDVTEHALTLLDSVFDIGWIRLMGIGAHKYTATLHERYWVIDWNSAELYIPSNRPHIKHQWFHRFYGNYPIGRKLGQTEEGFCHQCIDVARPSLASGNTVPYVAVPLNSHSETAWDHVGISWQSKGE